MRIFKDDLKPDLEITVYTDRTRAALMDLSAADRVQVIGSRINSSTGVETVLFDRVATGSAQGVIVMPWVSGDTTTLGDILIRVEVFWPGDKRQTIRPNSRVYVVA